MTYVKSLAPTVLVAVLLSIAAPALAIEQVVQQIPPVDACERTIKTMGGSMGHQASVSPDGKPVYKFILRTAGVDYDAICDAETGMVADVTRRIEP